MTWKRHGWRHIPSSTMLLDNMQNPRPIPWTKYPGLVPRIETLGEMFPKVPNRGTISDLERNLSAIGRECWDERYRPILPSA